MLQQQTDVISKSALFYGVNRDDLGSMLKCLSPKVNTYARNENITCTGDKFEALGVLLSGEATVYKENAAGNRIVLTILKPGDMFGEMIAFSRQSTWPVTVEATEGCTVFFLARERIVGECSNMCPWHRTLITNMLTVISERALRLNKQVEYFSIKSMRGKISAYLLEQHKEARSLSFPLPMNRNKLADFLGVSRPSMSREMSRMRDEGMIDYHLRQVHILDLETLKRTLN